MVMLLGNSESAHKNRSITNESRERERIDFTSIRKSCRDSYLDALSCWSYSFESALSIEDLVEKPVHEISLDEIVQLAESIDLIKDSKHCLESVSCQSHALERWIQEAGSGQEAAIRVTSYLAGVFIPIQIALGRQFKVLEILRWLVSGSLNQTLLKQTIGLNHKGISREQFRHLGIEVDQHARRFRYLMMAPIISSLVSNLDLNQQYDIAHEITFLFKNEYVAPCTLLRLGLLGIVIGSNDMHLFQRAISGAKSIGGEDWADLLIAYVSSL